MYFFIDAGEKTFFRFSSPAKSQHGGICTYGDKKSMQGFDQKISVEGNLRKKSLVSHNKYTPYELSENSKKF